MKIIEAALVYAKRGWLVAPLHSLKDGVCSCRKDDCSKPGKHPRTEHGHKDGSADTQQIQRWFNRWPDANLAIITGEQSGLVVLDVDGERGEESLKALTDAHGPLPKTLCVKTGRTGSDGKSNGCHHYFRAPAGVAIRNSGGVLGAGLDIRGEGGYVVAPPSLHASGLHYEWLNPEEPLADPPNWMLAMLVQREPVQVSVTEDWQSISEGGRNAALASLAGSMRRRGMCREAIEAALLQQNAAQCTPPPADSEVRDIAQSIGRYVPTAPVGEPERSAQSSNGRTPRQWPAPLAEPAFHGLAGKFVRLVGPQSEADPAALIFQFLAAFGSIVGRGPHFRVGGTKHYPNLFIVIVGNSSKARKGTSWSEVYRVSKLVDIVFANTRILNGLSTGEGLIHAVRDELIESVPIKERGRVIDREDQVTDPGEPDKRLLCVEGELGQTLQCLSRDGNTLSSIMRNAWDGVPLRVMTKNTKVSCAEPHISIIGHITSPELQRLLTDSDTMNGFANRFLWVASARSKCLPHGGTVDQEAVEELAQQVSEAVACARTVQEVGWSPSAAQRWEQVYSELSEGQPGLFGSVTARAEAQVRRLAMLVALLDKSAEIDLPHLEAALELWRYCEESAAYIFGQALGNPTADAILELLRDRPEGVTRTDVNTHFGRNKSKSELEAAISFAQSSGRLRVEKRETGGRPVELLQLVIA